MTTEPVRLRSAFEAMVNGVAAFFEALKTGTEIRTGYRQRPQQSNQGAGGANRIVFLPGDLGGGGGGLKPPRDVGQHEIYDASDPPVLSWLARPLVSWERTFLISVFGWDRSAPRNELAQLVVVETLLEQLVRAVEQVKGAGGPNLIWGGITWVIPKENTLGAEALVAAALVHPLFDAPVDLGRPAPELVRVGEDEG